MSALRGLRKVGVSSALALVAFVAATMVTGMVVGILYGLGVGLPLVPVVGAVPAVPGSGYGLVIGLLAGGYTFLWGVS